jgi:dihydropteroate synthase
MKMTLPATRCGNTLFRWGEKTYIMGICNLSPDSFSGDGLGAISRRLVAQRMIEEGTSSMSPGSQRPAPSQLRRGLIKSCGCYPAISVWRRD